MKNKEITKSISFFIILDLAIISAWFLLFTSINEKKIEVGLLQNNITGRVVRQNELSKLKLFVNDITEEKNQLSSVFIGEDSIVDFIESLEGIAKTSEVDLELRSVGVLNGKNKGVVTQFRITGKFENIFHYIALLEVSPYQIFFNRVNFSNKEGEESQADFDVVLTSFYEKD